MIFVFLSRMKRDETFRVNIVDHSNKSIDHPSCDHLQFATRIINNFIAEMYRTRVSYHESLDLFNASLAKRLPLTSFDHKLELCSGKQA